MQTLFFFVDPFFKKSERKFLNKFLRHYNLEIKPGYIKLSKKFVNGSNGLAPLFNDWLFYGTRINRAFFPFTTAIFGGDGSQGEGDFIVSSGDGAFLDDISVANESGLALVSRQNMYISRKSNVNSGGVISNIFVFGNSTFIQNKFKNLFDSKVIFNKILENVSEDVYVKSLNIPFSQEREIFLGRKVGVLLFFSVFVTILSIIFLALSFLFKPKELLAK